MNDSERPCDDGLGSPDVRMRLDKRGPKTDNGPGGRLEALVHSL
jgi:hypothetical protein